MPSVKKLKLQGFKSFAKPTEILFDKGLNTIIGPNGSGKSNLSDAICFVLGRLSIKSIRAAKAANLIYNGGKNNKPASEARIDLVIDNSDKTFAAGEEVVISRIVRRDGQSIYKIGEKTKTRQEVLDLLSQGGIDPYGFNIILQGEISRFVEMRPDERRGVIEDIAGISIYEVRKEKSLRELEKTDDKLKEISTVLHERTAYLKNLDKERGEALKYTNLEKTIKSCKASIITKDMKVKEQEKKKLEEEVHKKNSAKDKIKEKIAQIQGNADELNKEIGEINERVEKATGIEQEDLHREITTSKEGIASLKVRIENYTEQLNNLEKRTKQLNEDIMSSREELKKLEIEKSKRAKKAENLDLESFKEHLKEAAKDIFDHANEMSDLSNEIKKKVSESRDAVSAHLEGGRVKESINELKSLLGSLENHGNKHGKIIGKVTETRSRLNNLLKASIGEEEGRNIVIEISLKKQEMSSMELIVNRNEKEKERLKESLQKLKEDLDKQKKEGEKKESKEKQLYESFQKLFSRRNQLSGKLHEMQAETIKKQSEVFRIEEDINNLKISRAQIDAQLETLRMQFSEYKDVKIVEGSRIELEARIKRNEESLSKIGNVNLRALEVYDSVKSEYDLVAEKAAKLEKEKEEILRIVEEIDKKKKNVFMKTLNTISNLFSQNFMRLSGKGQVWLELENKEDPFAGGMDIILKIAKGKYMDASSLSGGEQVLVALSLIFAIQEYKPYCFYILDEIDAALDKRNSEKLAELLNSYVRAAQYIVITHNDAVISAANTLYGVSMQEGISKTVSLKL